MQAEYEDDGNHQYAETSSAAHAPAGEAEHSAGEEDDGEGGERPQKKKRIIKSRQSLAEKKIGTTLFPISRIKRIIKADKELDMMSAEATFLVAVATEYFIKHFMEEGYMKARLEKRRIVNYKDMANVVERSEEFEFLKDVIPLPITMSEALELRKKKLAQADESESSSSEEDEPPRAGPSKARRQSEHERTSDAGSGSGAERNGVTVAGHGDLPPLALSTNPLFPNAIVKRPSNTHARAAVPQPPKQVAAPPPPPTPRVHTGKNAPSTPHSLTTRGSARRSLNQQAPEQADPSPSSNRRGAEPIEVDDE
ncbi:Putative transcription factor [Vanrija pseudolonga]|uniref:Transcription factor n=1 Tax=Vanrija pseudolonga TaxID=143232 RepID=A0AAF1BKW8_9TREE|nr:Putative transcription factor [Vanrija pseudolonga]